jgi:hypothetical protein
MRAKSKGEGEGGEESGQSIRGPDAQFLMCRHSRPFLKLARALGREIC